jgi:CRP/FNR family transcriptional regulator, cyclic AMP receptor protein
MKKILIIDDDADLIENIAEILTLSEYQVIKAGNGKEGIEKSLKEKPDLIMCDVSMPGLDGFGVLHVLSRHPETFSTPFVFLTGRQGLTDLRRGMAMGADDYLTKPVNEDELLSVIDVRLRKNESLKRQASPAHLGFNELLQQVKDYDLINLTHISRDIHSYKKKHLLYSVGEKPVYVYFVVSGKLKEFLVNDEGKEFIIDMYSNGDFFGYTAILEDKPYKASIQILEDAELMIIPRTDFMQLVNQDRHISMKFINLLSNNIREKEEKLLNLAYNSLRKKVAAGIINVIDKFKDEKQGRPVIQISREDLANVVGAAQESMIRTLKEFKGEKLIEIVDGSIYILNENKLRHLVY